MYSVSCCAAIEILEYAPQSKHELCYVATRKQMEPRQPLSLTKFVELRSLCSKLRTFESKVTPLTRCSEAEHELCGITDGVEVRTIGFGCIVKTLRRGIHQMIFNIFSDAIRYLVPSKQDSTLFSMIIKTQTPSTGHAVILETVILCSSLRTGCKPLSLAMNSILPESNLQHRRYQFLKFISLRFIFQKRALEGVQRQAFTILAVQS